MSDYAEYGDALNYSEHARESLDFFETDFVDVFFYFEDEGHEVVYERFIMRLFPHLRHYRAICLGGKTKVIKKAKEERLEGNIYVFVVDKDFDDVLGVVETVPDLHYLRKYSLENYLFDVRAFIAVAAEEIGRKSSHAEIAKKLEDFPAFAGQLVNALIRLARYFIVARKYGVDIQTTKMPASDLLKESGQDWPIPSEGWMEKYRTDFKALCNNPRNEWLLDDECFNSQLQAAFSYQPAAAIGEVQAIDHVCGKHLIGCLSNFVDSRLQTALSAFDPPSLYTKLLNHVDMQPLRYLVNTLEQAYPKVFGKTVVQVDDMSGLMAA